MDNAGCVIATLVFLVCLIIFGPLLSIWSVNTLFGLTIPYTLKTWFATLWLIGAAGLGSTVSKAKSE